MIAQLMLLGFTLSALAFPVYGLLTGKLPDFGYTYVQVSRSDRPKTFWFLFAVYSFIAAGFLLCFIGRAIGLIQ
ncbi:MAG TPA: hypothetical protein VM145_04000 [Sphingomicrobium sp.]|nr:hypothetical protein [Sphingomicrobium sp.]